MEDIESDDKTEITEEDFFQTLKKFESKKRTMYQFLLNTGLQFKIAIFNICKRFISSEEFPGSFNVITLVQLPKKGSQIYLDNSRFLHMKLWMPRLVEALAVSKLKNDIIEAGTKYQIGGSMIELRMMEGEGCILTAVDIRKFFDKQSLCDAMHTLYQAKVNKKFYRVWYKLNSKTEIQVKTGAGLSARGLAGPVTGQGGGGAAPASALNLDRGVETYFRGSKDEDAYRRVKLQPLIYVDDLLRSNHNMNCLRDGNIKLDFLLREKQLEAHPTKSGYLIFGSETGGGDNGLKNSKVG